MRPYIKPYEALYRALLGPYIYRALFWPYVPFVGCPLALKVRSPVSEIQSLAYKARAARFSQFSAAWHRGHCCCWARVF